MTPQKSIDFIKRFEGFSNKAYADPGTGATPWTIGYGSTRHLDGSPVGRFDVITREVAEQLLRNELEFMSAQIKATVSQNQFDALCSFAYNCGVKALLRSTLYRKVKANPADPAIQAEFMKWTKAGGHVLDGLVKRRAAEWNLYNTP